MVCQSRRNVQVAVQNRQEKKFLEISAELRRYQAIEVEREKSETRESYLVAELVEIKAKLTKLRVLKGEE